MEFWNILGIAPTKDKREIKKNYATLSKQYHPEEHPEEFARLKSAYEYAIAFANSDVSLDIFTEPTPERSTEPTPERSTEEDFHPNPSTEEDSHPNPSTEEDSHPNPSSAELETHRGTLFDEDEAEQTLFPALSTLLIFTPKFQENPEDLRAFLFDWIFTTDFLDVFQQDAFFPQLFYVLNTLSPEEDSLFFPTSLEEALFTAYGLYYYQEEDGQYGLYLLEGMEFEGMHHLIHLLQFIQPSYSHVKSADDHTIPVHHLLLQRGFSDYNRFKALLRDYDDSFFIKSQLFSLFSYYTPFFINKDMEEVSNKYNPSEIDFDYDMFSPSDEDKLLHHRSYTALILLTHFIKRNKCPNTFLGMIYESIDLDNEAVFADSNYVALYETLRKTIKLQYSKAQYAKELKQILRLKDRFSRNFADTYLSAPHFINKYSTLYHNAFFPLHCIKDPWYLPKKKRDALERFFRTPPEQLLHLDFVQHALYKNMILHNCSQGNLFAHPLLLDSLLDFYGSHSGEIYQEIALELEGLRYQSTLLPYYYMTQPKTPENTTFPQAFTSPYFWYYFFSVSFPAAILTREIPTLDLYVKNTSLSTFLHNRFPPNLPWICAFTKYTPYQDILDIPTQTTLGYNDEHFTIFFLSNSTIIKAKEGLFKRNFTFEELESITKKNSYYFFLLFPLLRCDVTATVERTIREHLNNLPLPSSLLPELTRFLCASASTYLTNDDMHTCYLRQNHFFKDAMPSLVNTSAVTFGGLSHENKALLFQQAFFHPEILDTTSLPSHLNDIPNLKDFFYNHFPVEGTALTIYFNYCDTPTPPFLQTLDVLFRTPDEIEFFLFPTDIEPYTHCMKYTLGSFQLNDDEPLLFGITEDGDFYTVTHEGDYNFKPSFEELWISSTYGGALPLYMLLETVYVPTYTTLSQLNDNDLLEEFLNQ